MDPTHFIHVACYGILKASFHLYKSSYEILGLLRVTEYLSHNL